MVEMASAGDQTMPGYNPLAWAQQRINELEREVRHWRTESQYRIANVESRNILVPRHCVIGEGAFARIIRGKRMQDIAVKIAKPSQDGTMCETNEDAIGDELQNLERLGRHGRFIPALGQATIQNKTVTVFERAVYGNLYSFINGRRDRISKDYLLFLLQQACEAIAAIHRRGASHGDVKPHNFLLYSPFDVRVCDLSSLWWEDDGLDTSGVRPKGTLFYCSPEALQEQPDRGRACDMWSLALTITQLLIGHKDRLGCHPWGYLGADTITSETLLMAAIRQGKKPMQIGIDCIGADLKKALNLCFHLNPLMRPTAMDLVEELSNERYLVQNSSGMQPRYMPILELYPYNNLVVGEQEEASVVVDGTLHLSSGSEDSEPSGDQAAITIADPGSEEEVFASSSSEHGSSGELSSGSEDNENLPMPPQAQIVGIAVDDIHPEPRINSNHLSLSGDGDGMTDSVSSHREISQSSNTQHTDTASSEQRRDNSTQSLDESEHFPQDVGHTTVSSSDLPREIVAVSSSNGHNVNNLAAATITESNNRFPEPETSQRNQTNSEGRHESTTTEEESGRESRQHVQHTSHSNYYNCDENERPSKRQRRH